MTGRAWREPPDGCPMKKLNVILPAVLAAAAIGLMGWLHFHPTAAPEENRVVITVDGKEVKSVPLSRPQTVTVRQGDGIENVIEITHEGARMLSSTCDNQLCVHMGQVTVDNWELRPNQQFIICLPNRVTVELVVKE